MKKTFEEYLAHRHHEEYPEILDDNLPDAFDNWLSNLDVSEAMIYADAWMNETKAELAAEIRNLF